MQDPRPPRPIEPRQAPERSQTLHDLLAWLTNVREAHRQMALRHQQHGRRPGDPTNPYLATVGLIDDIATCVSILEARQCE